MPTNARGSPTSRSQPNGPTLRELPVPLRHAVIGAVVLGVTGGIVGLAIGFRTYVPTAWFAILEVGAPAALLGAVLGLVVGSLGYVSHYVHDN